MPNEMGALFNRHVVKIPDRSKEDKQLIKSEFRRVVRENGWDKWMVRVMTEDEFVSHQKGFKKTRYSQAFASLQLFPMSSKDYVVRCFLKDEKIAVGKAVQLHISMMLKWARMIQYRPPRYCGTIGRGLHPIERKLFGEWNLRNGLLNAEFSKGLHSFQIAAIIEAMNKWGDDGVYLCVDQESFDASVSIDWLRQEIWFYCQCLPRERWLHRLLKRQLINSVVTTNGLRYRCQARKMSGEYNTSLGDSLINYVLLKMWLKDLPHRMLINGDDSVICLPRSRLKALPGFETGLFEPSWFARFGFRAKVELESSVYRVEYCQTKPIEVRPGIMRCVRNPLRAMSRLCYTLKKYSGRGWLGYFTAIGQAELACSDGVPVLQSMAQCMIRHGKGVKPVVLTEYHPSELEPCRRPILKKIQPIARATFHQAFGLTVAEQLSIEAWYERCFDGYVEGLFSIECNYFKSTILNKVRPWRVEKAQPLEHDNERDVV